MTRSLSCPRAIVLLSLLVFPTWPTGAGSAAAQGSKTSKSSSSAQKKAARGDRYFAICDRDGNGWMSFKEAQASLGLDQAGFATYDADADGMVLAGEFRRRYLAIVNAGGVFAPPKTKAVPRAALPSTGEKMLESFDLDRDGAVDGAELDTALVDLGAARMDPEAMLDQFDYDGSRKLELSEIADLLALLNPGSRIRRGPAPKSIDELFGTLIPRSSGTASTLEPPRINGPVSTFRRLDADADGRISTRDLNELQRPFTFPVRPAAVVAALDTDGDSTISPAELHAAMDAPR